MSSLLEGKEGSLMIAGALLGVVAFIMHRNRKVRLESARKEFLNQRKKCMGILLIGPPGCGKGTIAQRIQTRLVVASSSSPNPTHVVDISTGDLLRKNIRGNSSEGLEAQMLMSQGKLIPDRLIVNMLKKKLTSSVPTSSLQSILSNASSATSSDGDEGDKTSEVVSSSSSSSSSLLPEMCWILDGFPRTKEHGDLLLDANIIPQHVLVFNIDEKKIIERIIGRRIDPVTNISYHVKFNPPPEDEPEVKARLIQRKDDKEEVVKKRLKVYETESSKVITWFKALASTSRGKSCGVQIHNIDANSSIDEVWSAVQKAIPALAMKNKKDD